MWKGIIRTQCGPSHEDLGRLFGFPSLTRWASYKCWPLTACVLMVKPAALSERGPPFLLLGIERMLGFFVKLILQLEARLIGFDRLNGLDDSLNPVVHFELAEFACGD